MEELYELDEWIENELPNDGYWIDDGFDSFQVAAAMMLQKGFNASEIKDIFQKIYSAVADEFS